MQIINVDTNKFRRFPASARIVSLMMMCNDIERLAYLRLLHARVEVPGLEYFQPHIGAYTMCLLCSHVYEALELIDRIKGEKQIGLFIEAEADLLILYRKVAAYKSNPLRALLYDIRNMITFHYKLNDQRLKTSLNDLTAAGYVQERLLIASENEATLHELAINAYDAMFLRLIGGSYTGLPSDQCFNGGPCDPNVSCNHSLATDFIQQVEAIQRDVRIFADALIKRFVSHLDQLDNFELGYIGINWSK